MSRRYIDCREFPSAMNCSVAISADSDNELLEAAVQHAVQVHQHTDSAELRSQLQALFPTAHRPPMHPGKHDPPARPISTDGLPRRPRRLSAPCFAPHRAGVPAGRRIPLRAALREIRTDRVDERIDVRTRHVAVRDEARRVQHLREDPAFLEPRLERRAIGFGNCANTMFVACDSTFTVSMRARPSARCAAFA